MIRRVYVIWRIGYFKRTIGRCAVRTRDLSTILSGGIVGRWTRSRNSIVGGRRMRRTKFRWIWCRSAKRWLAFAFSHQRNRDRLGTMMNREIWADSDRETEMKMRMMMWWEPRSLPVNSDENDDRNGRSLEREIFVALIPYYQIISISLISKVITWWFIYKYNVA